MGSVISNFIPILLDIPGLFIIPYVIPSLAAGFFIAIVIHRFTKKRKIALIGFISGTIGILIINFLIILGLRQLWLNEPLFEFWYHGYFDFLYPAPIPFVVTPSLLLSAGITFLLVQLRLCRTGGKNVI